MVQTRSSREAEANGKGSAVRNDSTEKTLLQEAELRQRQVAQTATATKDEVVAKVEQTVRRVRVKEELPPVDRIALALFFGVCLGLVHYVIEIVLLIQFVEEPRWKDAWHNFMRSFPIFLVFFYVLHRHVDTETVIPGLPAQYQARMRKALFFTLNVACSTYTIITWFKQGPRGAVKVTPPLLTLWLWTMVEQEWLPAASSLAIAAATAGYASVST